VRHALHRLLAPRHPPTALCSLTDQAEASAATGEPAAPTRQVKLTSFLEGYPIAAAVFKVLPQGTHEGCPYWPVPSGAPAREDQGRP
jgi:hypothetical protein